MGDTADSSGIDNNGTTPAAFAPPANPIPAGAVPGAPPPWTPPPSVLIDVQQPAKRKRTGLWVGIAAVVALVAGGGAFLALRKDDADKRPTFSLAEAATNADETTSYTFHMTNSALGAEIQADGAIDTVSKVMSLEIDTGGQGIGGFSAIMDLDNKVMYMSAEPFKELIPDLDAAFIKFDLAELAEETGTSMFDELPVDEPLSIAPLLAAGDVTDLGIDDVNGEPVHHYRVIVDSAELIKVNPQIEQTFEDAGSDLPDTITYDVYVTEDNELRRTHVEMLVADQLVVTDMIITPTEADAAPIEAPSDDDVVDFKDLEDLAG